MHQNQQQLPFPPDQVIDGNWIDDPFRARLPLPQIPMDHNLQWLPEVVGQVFIDELQRNCQAGFVSTFAYNFFSNNFYNNKAFGAVFQDAIDHALFVLSTSNVRDPQQVQNLVAQVAAVHSVIATALTTQYYPELNDYVDQAGYNQLQAEIQKWNRICAAMDQQSNQYAPRGGYTGQPGAPAGGSRPQYQGGGHQRAPAAGPGAGYQRRGAPVREDAYAVRGATGIVPQRHSGYINPGVGHGTGPVGRANATGQSALRPDAHERPMSDALRQKLIANGELQEVEPEMADLGVTEREGSVAPNARASAMLRDSGVLEREVGPQGGGRAPADVSTERQAYPQQHQRPRLDAEQPNLRATIATAGATSVDIQEQPVAEQEKDWTDDLTFDNEKENLFPSLAIKRIILPVPPIGLSVEKLKSYYEDNANQTMTIARWNDDPEAPWDLVTLTNGMLLIPAVKSTYTVSRTAHRPNPNRPYDPSTHVKFHLIDAKTSTVTEVIMVREPSMEYAILELDSKLRNEAELRTNEKMNVMPDWSVVTTIQPRQAPATPLFERLLLAEQDAKYQETREEGAPEVDQQLRKKPLILSTEGLGSLEQVMSAVDQFRLVGKEGVDGVDRILVEAHGRALLPFITEAPVELVDALSAATAAADPAQAMVEALQAYGSVAKDRLYNRISDLLTARTNDAILYSLGIEDLRITNFVGDYESLLESVREVNGDSNYERLKILVGTAVTQLGIFRGDDELIQDSVVSLEGFDLEYFEENKTGYVFLRHEFAVLYINYALATLGLKSTFTQPEQITASDQEHLFNLIEGVEFRTRHLNDSHGGSLYVISADDRVLNIHTSAWDKNYRSVSVAAVGQHSII